MTVCNAHFGASMIRSRFCATTNPPGARVRRPTCHPHGSSQLDLRHSNARRALFGYMHRSELANIAVDGRICVHLPFLPCSNSIMVGISAVIMAASPSVQATRVSSATPARLAHVSRAVLPRGTRHRTIPKKYLLDSPAIPNLERSRSLLI